MQEACRRWAWALAAWVGTSGPLPSPGQTVPSGSSGDAGAETMTVTHLARAMAPGEVIVVTIDAPQALATVDVGAFGRTVPGFGGGAPTRWHALVPIDLATPPGEYALDVIASARAGTRMETRYTIVVDAREFPTRRLRVAPRYVFPPKGALARIERERKRLGGILATVTPERLWQEPFVQPVAAKPTSAFGSRSVFNGRPSAPHRGTDFASPVGTPVHAPNAGRVVLADDLYYTGRTVVIDHGLGLFSLLAHLSRRVVAEGDPVGRQATIGYVGATGRVTGPHLHWTVRVGSTSVDPLSLLAVLGPSP